MWVTVERMQADGLPVDLALFPDTAISAHGAAFCSMSCGSRFESQYAVTLPEVGSHVVSGIPMERAK
jgi:hypothetical protein